MFGMGSGVDDWDCMLGGVVWEVHEGFGEDLSGEWGGFREGLRLICVLRWDV